MGAYGQEGWVTDLQALGVRALRLALGFWQAHRHVGHQALCENTDRASHNWLVKWRSRHKSAVCMKCICNNRPLRRVVVKAQAAKLHGSE